MFNTLRPRQNGWHFADDIFKHIFLNENVRISLKIWLKYVPKVWINNIPALVEIMAWCRPGDKPLSEAMLVSLLMHKCVTQPQWVKGLREFLYMFVDLELHDSLRELLFNSSPYLSSMWQWIWPALVQIMLCRLFGAKPLSKPMLGYCQ